eukprot:7695979-Pyramimonas_sp.AAC.2
MQRAVASGASDLACCSRAPSSALMRSSRTIHSRICSQQALVQLRSTSPQLASFKGGSSDSLSSRAPKSQRCTAMRVVSMAATLDSAMRQKELYNQNMKHAMNNPYEYHPERGTRTGNDQRLSLENLPSVNATTASQS